MKKIHAEENKRTEKTVSNLNRDKKSLLAQIKQLQTCSQQQKSHESPEKQTITETNVFEVEKILAQKKEGDVWYYRIHWKGFSSKHDTWEKESNLQCPQILNEFKETVEKNNK